MSKSDLPSTTPELKTEMQKPTCAGGCNHSGGGIMRAVAYTPIVLLAGAMAAIAMFPNLAEYATPLIGESTGNLTCALKNTSGEGHCCASMQAAAGCCPTAGIRTGGGCGLKRFHCILNPESSVDSEAPINAELTNSESELRTDDSPADAYAAVNSVDAETPSN
jgi:hypothetical protein